MNDDDARVERVARAMYDADLVWQGAPAEHGDFTTIPPLRQKRWISLARSAVAAFESEGVPA